MRSFGRRMIIISIILLVLSSAFIVLGGGGDSAAKGEVITLPSMIRTARPEKMDFSERLPWFGLAKSRSEVTVYAITPGRIISQKAVDGAPVKRGDVLFTIGGTRALDRLKTLKEKIDLTKKRITLANKDVRIKREAVKSRMIKGEELRATVDSLMRLKTGLAGLRQDMTSLRVGLTVRASVGGVFTNRMVNKGQYVEKGTRLADIISPQNLRVTANIFAPDGAELKGLKAIIKRPGGKTIIGTIKKVMPELTKEGARIIWIEGDNLNTFLRPGEILSGLIELTKHSNGLSIPASSVVRDDRERPFVFIKKEGKYLKMPIQTGLTSEEKVEVISGVQAGDRVVISGAYELFYRGFSNVFKVAD